MEIVLIELIFWAGLVFFFWMLRDDLNNQKIELETQKRNADWRIANILLSHFDRADTLSELIGRYLDKPIYRSAVINGTPYKFKHILPQGSFSIMNAEECCLEPGLVYGRCVDC